MVTREIINIDESKCNGCGNCVTGCKEGAIQIINGKAKLVNEEFCDGFGDCIGECPTGALTIEKREAKDFNLKTTVEHVKNIRGEEAVEEMLEAQKEHDMDIDNEKVSATKKENEAQVHQGCPGSKTMILKKEKEEKGTNKEQTDEMNIPSELNQWPVQIHLLPPQAPFYDQADLLIAADCVSVAYGNFQKLIKDKTIAVGCPKLDDADSYVQKLTDIITNNDIKSISIAKMEVPCCGGIVRIVQKALENADSKLDLNIITIGINGEIKD